ncbi:MAG: 50S ribosomal protein L3 [Gammaproteobacteria bacterium]|nr:50S ribosomal protein L3 [Gammaproteobacteria bacterium]MDH3407582.1 50S ribosomal protein L3 [Gammaproteobacteria bacterium]MDH3563036.1 50S ribosomal protein L3 [Gammaproteobacteria bacterium]MDH5486212.1 50S ribosomal protein L3 [Gammaproteobacteria bacterium]
MALGLVGRKIGMTRLFKENGEGTPVTVLEVTANRVAQVKDEAKDGYRAVQLTVGNRRADRLTKPMAGKYAKAGVEPGRQLREFRLAANEGADLKAGTEVKLDIFQVGSHVDVQGISIGKGFAGVMKRHHFAGGRASHGNSLSHRVPGSIGQRQTPGRVFPGKKMAGHLGDATATCLNLEVMQVDAERHLLMVKGAVPGPKGHDVMIRPSVKMKVKSKPTKAAK